MKILLESEHKKATITYIADNIFKNFSYKYDTSNECDVYKKGIQLLKKQLHNKKTKNYLYVTIIEFEVKGKVYVLNNINLYL